jgi:hypothetical protein
VSDERGEQQSQQLILKAMCAVAVGLSLALATAVEQIALDQGLAAEDLVWPRS